MIVPMDNSVSEVHLRKRPTPYDFVVELTSGSATTRLYDGTSARYAKSSYWQAVSVGVFLKVDGAVRVVVTRSRTPYGAFETEVEAGRVRSLHIPSGKCVEWTTGSWEGEHLAEKLIATIPGMPGPVQSPH